MIKVNLMIEELRGGGGSCEKELIFCLNTDLRMCASPDLQ